MALAPKDRWKIVKQLREYFATSKQTFTYAALWENRVVGWMLDQWFAKLGPAGDAKYTKMVKRYREVIALPTPNHRWLWYHDDIELLLSKI